MFLMAMYWISGSLFIREIKGGSSHASMNSLIAHFGLGTNEQIDSILVDWVGGEAQTVVGAQINHRYSIKQGVDPFVKVTFELNANLIDVDENGK